MTRVLCIAAHPDDEVLGVGGTLVKHRRAGDEVYVAILGPCSTRDDSQWRDAKEALKQLGLRDNAYMPPHPRGRARIVTELEDLVADLKPDIVYTHSRADLHSDHQEALQRALVACRPQSGVQDIYCFETPSATDWSGVQFDARQFVDITDTISYKEAAMEAYQSELREPPHPRNLENLRQRAAYWGQRVGVKYAEAFEVVRSCW